MKTLFFTSAFFITLLSVQASDSCQDFIDDQLTPYLENLETIEADATSSADDIREVNACSKKLGIVYGAVKTEESLAEIDSEGPCSDNFFAEFQSSYGDICHEEIADSVKAHLGGGENGAGGGI